MTINCFLSDVCAAMTKKLWPEVMVLQRIRHTDLLIYNTMHGFDSILVHVCRHTSGRLWTKDYGVSRLELGIKLFACSWQASFRLGTLHPERT